MGLIAALRKIRACEGETAAQLVLEYAIAEAVSAEREACACIAESINDGCTGAPDGPEEIAAAIRLRSNAMYTAKPGG